MKLGAISSIPLCGPLAQYSLNLQVPTATAHEQVGHVSHMHNASFSAVIGTSLLLFSCDLNRK